MAGKTNVDDSVIERRLRPIYDWLDNGNNKKAVQEADKVLRKQPKLQCASVLKALALLRLGKNSECLDLINTVVSEGTADDATLQALTICYREMHQPELICSIYEKASKLDPSNEDIMSHLFMAHVRVGDYKKQQRTALQLYKLKPKNPYYFWAVMSIVMQAHVCKDSVAKKVSLQLAERMILKLVEDDKIESEAEVLTYLYILEIQEKYSEVLSVMEGPLARRIVQQQQNFIPMKKANCHTRLEQFEAASIIYRNLIVHELDNWQHYVHYTESFVSMWGQFSLSPEGKTDPLLEASQFLKDTREKALVNRGVERSPLLGVMQLVLKLKENGLEEKIECLCGDMSEHLYVYVTHYGDKTCCYGDIVNFLRLIPSHKVDHILEKVKDLVQMDDKGVPLDIKNIYRHQIWLQMMHSLRDQELVEAEAQVKFADAIVGVYQSTSSFSAEMAPTDIRPNDTYLIIAAHSYFRAISQFVTKCVELSSADERKRRVCDVTNLVVKLCALLEHGINISKANFQLKLLLIKAYNKIGAISSSFSVYEKLDMKQIQMDTLGHVLAFQTLDTGNYPLAANIFSSTLKFFMANYKDTSDPLIMSYKFGSLIRIPEFVEFRERLNNSIHFATVTAEKMILELTTGANCKSELEEAMKFLDIDPVNEKTNWDDLRDNRDLQVMNTWEPKDRQLQPSLKESTFGDDVCLLRLKNTIIRVVAASFNLRKEDIKNNVHTKDKCALLNGDSNGTCDTPIVTLRDLVNKLRKEAERCDKYRIAKPPQIPLQGPDVPRIYLYLKGEHLPCILKHAELLLTVYDCTEGTEGMDSWSSLVLKNLLETSEELISFHLPHLQHLQVTSRTALPDVNIQPLGHLSNFIQTVSLIVILLDCCQSLLIPVKTSIAKKNKKKKGNVALPEIISHFNIYVSTLHSKLHKMELSFSEKINLLKSEYEETNSPSGSQRHNFDTIIPALDVKTVCESIHHSFVLDLTNLYLVLKNKLKYLNLIKV